MRTFVTAYILQCALLEFQLINAYGSDHYYPNCYHIKPTSGTSDVTGCYRRTDKKNSQSYNEIAVYPVYELESKENNMTLMLENSKSAVWVINGTNSNGAYLQYKQR